MLADFEAEQLWSIMWALRKLQGSTTNSPGLLVMCRLEWSKS
jgi:hypothetical protein